MSIEIFDPAFSTIERAMGKSVRVQETISNNVANAQTPGYVPKKFDEVLNKEIDRQDRKTVNLEEEMAEMSKNSGKYSAYIKLLSAKLGVLRSVVTMGRK